MNNLSFIPIASKQGHRGLLIGVMIIVLLLAMTAVAPVTATATEKYGTFSAGIKTWAAVWDAGIAKFGREWTNFYGRFTGLILAPYNYYITTEDTIRIPGFGLMAGPTLGYTSPNGKWSLGVAVIWFSFFRQDVDNVTYYTVRIPQNLILKKKDRPYYDLSRSDVDASVSYRVSNLVQVFLGYKYQKIEIDEHRSILVRNASIYSTNLFIVSRYLLGYNRLSITMQTHGISPGCLLSHPYNDTLTLNLQLGVIAMKPLVQAASMENPRNWFFGMNIEPFVVIRANPHVFCQVGYRLQLVNMEFNHKYIYYHTVDLFQGITVTVNFIW